MKIYLVGGAVRDLLLGLQPKEKDYVVVGATIEDMVKKGFQPIGKDFPVFLHPTTHEEYALARTEKKIAKGYHGFEFYTDPNVTLEEDLLRRDLTINAMAMNEQGRLVDPYGGEKDLKQKIIRHVSDAFIEDPVRILRAARFYARFFSLGFTIDHSTQKLIQAMVLNEEAHELKVERVWLETIKALNESNPEKYFEALRFCNALAVLFPEVHVLFGVPGKPSSHPEIDTGIHTMMVLQQAALVSQSATVRFSVLCHDFGKSLTPMHLWPRHQNHELKGAELVANFCKRLKVPNEFRDLARLVTQVHGIVHSVFQLRPKQILDLMLQCDAFRKPERFKNILEACDADFKGRPGYENETYLQRKFFEALLDELLKIKAKDLIQMGYQSEKLIQAIRVKRLLLIKGALCKIN